MLNRNLSVSMTDQIPLYIVRFAIKFVRMMKKICNNFINIENVIDSSANDETQTIFNNVLRYKWRYRTDSEFNVHAHT